MDVAGIAKTGKTLEKSRCPLDIAALNRVREIGELDREKCAHLAQILDRPSGRSRSELSVGSVDLRAMLDQRSNCVAMPAKSGVMQRCRSGLVALIDELRMCGRTMMSSISR